MEALKYFMLPMFMFIIITVGILVLLFEFFAEFLSHLFKDNKHD